MSRSSRRIWQPLLWIALVALPWISLGDKPSRNLVNAGFEESTREGFPTGWSMDPAARAKGTVSLSSTVPGAKGMALQLSPNADNGGEKPLGIGQVLDARPWRGQRVEIRAWLGSGGACAAVLGVHALTKNGDRAFVQLRQDDSKSVLAPRVDHLTIPSDAETLIVYVIATGTSGQAWFDSLSLTPTAPDAKTGGGNAALASMPVSATATVTVTPGVPVRRIPPGIFGTNVEWIFDGQGLWAAGKRSLDENAVRLARDLAPTVLRFPGGVLSDTYDWHNGIGPQDKRPTTPHYPGGPQSRHTMGSQEVADLARQVGSELLFTVNAGTGEASDAADWVRYAKERIQPRVTWWEVGNELYMKDDLSGAHMSAGRYADRFLTFARAMRAADPDIQVGAIGGLNRERYRFIADDRWTETVLRRAGKEIDFLAVHDAYAPVVMEDAKDLDPTEVYRAMLGAPVQIESNLRELSRLLARYESPSHPIRIAVTEWGPFFHVLPSSPWVDHVKTMGSALFVASTLNVFMRSERVELANFFKLSDHGFMGWIGHRQGVWTHTAPGLVFGLYRAALGKTLIPTRVDAPGFDHRHVGVVDAGRAVPYLDAVATFDNGELVLMLVNKSDRLTLDLNLEMPGVRAYGSARAHGYQADGLDAHTGTQLPQIPGIEWATQTDLGRFSRGGPGEIRVIDEPLEKPAAAKGDPVPRLRYALRPLSVVAIRVGGVRLGS